MREITVFTHRRPEDTAATLRRLAEEAARVGAMLRLDEEETQRHGLSPGPGMEVNAPIKQDVDLCVVLGGDGTILRALQAYAGTGVAVFAINFGEIGFLATVERDEASSGFRRAFDGDFEVLFLPGLKVSEDHGVWLAINDVSIHRQAGRRVADLAYAIGADEVGRVRCDGLVVGTPAGSTGYNLANGGPVMAWGVEGFAVSFIAPHSLTARSLVVAPSDVLVVHNRSREESVDVAVDGRPVGVLEPAEQISVVFTSKQGALAQVPGTTFYHRLSEKFGRLVAPL